VFSKNEFNYVMLFWMALMLSLVMSLVMTYANAGFIPFPGILLTILLGTCIAYIAGSVVPIAKLAHSLALACKLKEGKLLFHLLTNLVMAVYFATLMTIAFTAMAIGFPLHFWKAVLYSLPLALTVGYIAGVLLSPIAVKLAHLMCSK
jgi:hypothetical protein